jgi:hypothetical protein
VNYPNVEREHVILWAGAFEETTYVDGEVVDVRVYALEGTRVTKDAAPRRLPQRATHHRPEWRRTA